MKQMGRQQSYTAQEYKAMGVETARGFKELRNTRAQGLVHEIPNIKVDDFKPTEHIRAYFLTHAHSDHMAGLGNKNFTGPLYATEQTKQTVLVSGHMDDPAKRNTMYEHLGGDTKWRVLELNTPTVVHEYQLTSAAHYLWVTAIEAKHCPGSCMFLFEYSDTAVLYTGDVRAEEGFVRALKENPYLFKYTAARPLDAIYLDTEFGYRWAAEYVEFPRNIDSLERVKHYIQVSPPETIFAMNLRTTGLEPAICYVSAVCKEHLGNGKIHMSPGYVKIYQVLASVGNAEAKYIVDNLTHVAEEAALHCCRKADRCPQFKSEHRIWMKAVVNEGVQQVADWNTFGSSASHAGQHRFNHHEDAKEPLEQDDDEEEGTISRSDAVRNGQAFVRGISPNTYIPRCLKFHYSRHSSYSETRHLVSVFRPRSVYPNWQNPYAFRHGGFVMMRLYGSDCCHAEMLKYDREMLCWWSRNFPHDAQQVAKDYDCWVTNPVHTTWSPVNNSALWAQWAHDLEYMDLRAELADNGHSDSSREAHDAEDEDEDEDVVVATPKRAAAASSQANLNKLNSIIGMSIGHNTRPATTVQNTQYATAETQPHGPPQTSSAPQPLTTTRHGFVSSSSSPSSSCCEETALEPTQRDMPVASGEQPVNNRGSILSSLKRTGTPIRRPLRKRSESDTNSINSLAVKRQKASKTFSQASRESSICQSLTDSE